MDLKEQLVIWKKSEYLVDNLAWTAKLQDRLVEEEILTAPMVADIHSYRTNIERKLRFFTLLGTHNTDVFKRFLRALQSSDHGPLARELQRVHRLTKFGEMLPPMFTYFLDLSAFLRKYPHIGLKLGEDGKHLLQSFIDGKISVEIRKHHELLETLQATNEKLVADMAANEKRMADAQEKQLAAEALWASSGGRIDNLNDKIKELETENRAQQQEIRHLKHFFRIQNDLEDFIEEEYKEYVPMTAVSIIENELESSRSVKVSQTDTQKFHLLQSQVSLNIVRLDLVRTSIQNLAREEKRVQGVLDNVEKDGEADASVKNEVSSFLADIKKTKAQLETQLDDGEQELIKQEKELADREKEYEIPSEISVRTHIDLIAKLKAIIENLKIQHARKLREQKMKHGREIDDMIDRMQKMNVKHMEEVEKLKGTIRKKMFEIHKREQLHKKLRDQIRVMENYQSRNMNATVSVEQCRKIVRAIIGEARILRDIADEKESIVQQAEQEAERKMDEKENNSTKKDKKGKKGKGNKNKKKKKIPASLNEERLRYMAEKVRYDWRGLGLLLGLTENRLDIVEMDAGSGSAERTAYYMFRVWRDEEAGTPSELALALLEMGQQQLATLILPMSKLVAMKKAIEAEKNPPEEEEEERLVESSIPTLPQIQVK